MATNLHSCGRPLAFALVLASLASPASAQFTFTSIDDVLYSPALQPCSRVSYGNVFGGPGVDAVMLFGDRAVAYQRPEVYQAGVVLNASGSDVAVYHESPQVEDWVFVVGPNGLYRFQWNGSAFVGTSDNVTYPVWVGAQSIGVR